MGLYSNVIFPRLLDWFMARGVLAEYRRRLLSDTEGEVLEIGFGTGVNLPYYPPQIRNITAVDRNPGMNAVAQTRIRMSSIVVEHRVVNAETLPMPDHSFDTVVSTMTMCSITDLSQALREIRRVLKPGGKLLFLEHGLSPDPKVQAWQHRLTPVTRLLGDGCHLNRNIQRHIEAHPFRLRAMTQFYLEETPKVGGYMYQGVAVKA